jgi:hypothetical protein
MRKERPLAYAEYATRKTLKAREITQEKTIKLAREKNEDLQTSLSQSTAIE